MKNISLLSILFLSLFVSLTAQDGYILKNDSIQSSILKQNRKLSVYLPEGYDAPNAKFPVIYVLDADGRCQHTVPTARFLFLNNKMPKAIIVGVYNIDRNHDFLPAGSPNAPTGGGADNFLQFFKTELIPFIDQKFKTEHFNVLEGHSYGGVFVMHVLLNDPDLFNAYIAIDPSFWYNNQMQVKSAKIEFLKSKNWQKPIYITGRQGGGLKDMGITSMEKLLKSSAPKALNWKIVSYANEDHGSVTFKSVYDGLRFIFDIGNNFAVYPQSGILPKGASTYAFIENKNPNLRYTTDGSEPTINSPVCNDKIKINGPCTLKVKSVSTQYTTQPSVSRIFSDGAFMNSNVNPDGLKQGLKYSYFEGVWDSIPDFSGLAAKKTGIAENIDLRIALKKDSFAIVFEGYIHITRKDLYNLWIVSDDGSKLYIDNQLILNNDGLHGANNPVVKLLPMNAGYYPVKILYFEKTGDESISVGTLVGKKKPMPISKEMLFYKE